MNTKPLYLIKDFYAKYCWPWFFFQILLYLAGMGEHKFFLDGAFMGGPLGELVQWCDLISALYILGHELTIGFEVGDIPR